MRIRHALLLAASLAALACGIASAGEKSVSARELTGLRASASSPLVLDVRTPEEFAAGHVPGAVNIPHTEVAARLAEIEPESARGVVVYCERGGRAAQAAEALGDAGLSDVRLLEGHMQGWREAGLPVER